MELRVIVTSIDDDTEQGRDRVEASVRAALIQRIDPGRLYIERIVKGRV